MSFAKHADRSHFAAVRSLLSVLAMVVVVVLLSWGLRAFVFQAYEIPSGSMIDTIEVGDMVFSEKVSYYFRTPAVGEIVTFDDPKTEDRTLIKRVIATAGQTVNINDEDGLVYVDGVPLEEAYTDGKPSYTLSGGVTFPYTVPDDCIWVMGDNRTNSSDSRFFGAIDVSAVSGRAVLIYWPFSHFGLLESD